MLIRVGTSVFRYEDVRSVVFKDNGCARVTLKAPDDENPNIVNLDAEQTADLDKILTGNRWFATGSGTQQQLVIAAV